MSFLSIWQWQLEWPLILSQLTGLWTPSKLDVISSCTALADLKLENTTILSAAHFATPTKVSTLGICARFAEVRVPMCRVQFLVRTTNESQVLAEAWMPDDWNGGFLGLGNAGHGGCKCFQLS